MSTGPDDRHSYRPYEEPMWAELVDPSSANPSPRIWLRVIMGVIAVLVVVLILGAGIVGVVFVARAKMAQGLNQNPNVMPPQPQPPPVDRVGRMLNALMPQSQPLIAEREKITAALDGKWHISEEDPKYADVRQLLSELEKASTDDRQTFINYVDWQAHMVRFYRSYRWSVDTAVQRGELERIERQQFTMPTEAKSFKIAVVEEKNTDDWYIYTYAQEGNLANAAYLFHVHRKFGTWRLVDWAEIAEFTWESEANGFGTGLMRGDPAWDELNLIVDEIKESDRLLAEQDVKGAEDLLRQAEARKGVAQLQDSNLYLIAARWNVLNKPDEAERVLNRISNPDLFPWAHHLRAFIHHNRGNYAEALTAIEKFQRCAGFYRELEVLKARCHIALKEGGPAEATCLAVLRYSPENDESLSLAIDNVPPERLSEIFDLLPDKPETITRLAQAARSVLYSDRQESFTKIRDFISTKAPDSADVMSLDAHMLHYQGKLDEALSLYKQILVLEQDEDKRYSTHSEYLTLLLEFKSPVKAYEESVQPREALEIMTEGIGYDDESLISTEQLEEILPLHREKVPDDPKLPWYVAQVAITRQDWSTAATELTKVLQASDLGDDEEHLKQSIRNQLLQAQYHLGQALDVYRKSEDPGTTFQSLATLMEQSEDWEGLKQLYELHRSKPQDLWARYYGLRLQEKEARKAENAEQLAAVLAGYKALAQENLATKTVYTWLLDARLNELGLEGSGWRSFLESQDKPQELFTTLVTRFQREKNDQALQELIAFARQRFPDDAVLRNYELEQLWEAQNYEGIIAYCAAHPDNSNDDGNYQYTFGRQQRLLISYLMLGDTGSAWKVASEPTANVELQWLVKLAEGNLDAIREFLQQHPEDLYAPLSINAEARNVPAIQRFLESEAFRQLRSETALPLGYEYVFSRALVFFSAPVLWTTDNVRERLERFGLGDLEVEQLAKPPLTTNSFRIRSPSIECSLTYLDRPYVTAADLDKFGQSLDASFKQALAGHQHWIALEPRRELQDEADPTWLRIVAAFAVDGTALWETMQGGRIVQVVMTPDVVQQLTSEPEKLRSLALPTNANAWLPESELEEEKTTSDSADTEHGEDMSWHARCRAAVEGKQLGRVKVRVGRGEAVEEHWLDVVSVKHQQWGRYSIEARMQQSSVLNSMLAKGDLVRLNQYDIQDWQD